MMIDADEMIVDGFAGGGGASLGIEMALGRSPDLAYNHDAQALALHAANHPATRHVCRNIYLVDPMDEVRNRRVGLGWFSPDCKHFSKAKGGRPVKRSIRDLAWIVVQWAKRARPRVIMLENVEEFRDWGPLVMTDAGHYFPDPDRKGETFAAWCMALRRLGYRLGWQELRGCDYGAPTIRKRLFLVARRDGAPIVFPEPTHGAGLLPYRTAADIIDWSIPCPSIFLTREEGRAQGVNRPLAEATMARIAKGVKRYVIDAANPFIVPITHTGGARVHDIDEPLRTVTTAHRGEFGLVVPTLIEIGYGERPGQAPRVPGLDKPLGTVVAGGVKHALVAAFLAQHNTGMTGHDARTPLSTIVQRGTTQAVVSAGLVNLKGSGRGMMGPGDQVPTITAGGTHVSEVRAFLIKYYGNEKDGHGLTDPIGAVTTHDRFGLVTVHGEPYQIVDIGMRMLTPRELFRAQGFPDSYIIDRDAGGAPINKTVQVRLVGNSVCPPVANALVRANFGLPAVDFGRVAA